MEWQNKRKMAPAGTGARGIHIEYMNTFITIKLYHMFRDLCNRKLRRDANACIKE